MDIFGTLDANGDHVIDENEWMHGARTLAMSTFAGMRQKAQCESRIDQAHTSIDEDVNLMQIGANVLAGEQDADKTSVQKLEHKVAVLQDKLHVFQEQQASGRGREASQVEDGGALGKTEVEKLGGCQNPDALPVATSSAGLAFSLNPHLCNMSVTVRCPAHYCEYDASGIQYGTTDVDFVFVSPTTVCYSRHAVQYRRKFDYVYTCEPLLPPVASNFYDWSGSQLSFYCPHGKGSKRIGVRGEIYGPGGSNPFWDHFANVPKKMRPEHRTSTADGAKRMSSSGQPEQDYAVTVFEAGYIEFHPPGSRLMWLGRLLNNWVAPVASVTRI